MSEVARPTYGVDPRAAEGIACVVIGMTLFVGQDAMMKSLIDAFPIWVLMAVRGLIAILALAPLIMLLGAPHRLLTPLWYLHLTRASLFATGFALFYAAFPFMGLAEVSTIFFSAPLMTTVLAVVFLRERIGIHRIVALVIGFAGVVIAMNPDFGSFRWITVLPLTCALAYAASQIIARQIGERESSLTTGLYTVVFSSLLLLAAGWIINRYVAFEPEFRHLGWHLPVLTPSLTFSIAFLGVLGSIGYILISRAYQVTNASLVAPFDYSYLPLATLVAFLVWEEVPTSNTVIGMVLIIGSGLYLGYRELRSNRVQAEPLPVAEATLAPGNPIAPIALSPDVEEKTS